MRGEVEGRHLDSDTEERDRAHAVVLLRESRGAAPQREQRGIAILERHERPREAAVRVRVPMLAYELAVRGLGLTKPAAREELRRCVTREAMVVRHPRFGRSTLLGERLRELRGLLVVHDTARRHARALREREDMGALDVIRVDAQRMELS